MYSFVGIIGITMLIEVTLKTIKYRKFYGII